MSISPKLRQNMNDGIFGSDDSEAEISRLKRAATRRNWTTPDGVSLEVITPPTVYPPKEDTDLLCRALRNLGPGKGQRLLEIGCGSGAASLYAACLGYRVRACDINPYAVAATRANAEQSNLNVDVHEGGPGPAEDGSIEQWAGLNTHDVLVWNLPYLTHDQTIDQVLGPLEEAALLDTDQIGLSSRLMLQVSENQLLAKNGIMLLLVSANERGKQAELEAQKHGFAARYVAEHTFDDGEELRVLAVWHPYAGSRIQTFETVASTNQTALEHATTVGDFFRADVQTEGRGRRGRSWSSESECFAGSWLIASGKPSMAPGLMQILGGYAVVTTHRLLGIPNEGIALKWPNDVYHSIDDNLGKIAGVLVEGTSKGNKSAIVLGIGVNLSTNNADSRTYPIAHLNDQLPHISAESYAPVIHAVIASFFEQREGIRDNKNQDILTAIFAEIKRSQGPLGRPIYRGLSWQVSNLDDQGTLTLVSDDGQTEGIADGEDLIWPALRAI